MNNFQRIRIASWFLRATAAIILVQTLYFKFTAAPESVYIFSLLGLEPWGRIATGIVELVAAILLIVPRTAAVGGLVSLGVISGAITSHLTRLGIALPLVDDHGELFFLAMVVFAASSGVVAIHWGQLRQSVRRLAGAADTHGALRMR